MSQRVTFGPFALDPANAMLLRDGARIDMTPKAFDLLVMLARRPGELVTKDEILDEVWGRRFVSESVVKTVISDLRTALEDDARAPRWVETVARRGYRFIGQPSSAPVIAARIAEGDSIPIEELSPQLVIGRADAFASLRRAWVDAGRGVRRLVFVTGEPGMGKTTLLTEFVHQLDGAAVAMGQCVEHYGSGEPYLPVLEALNTLCNDDPAVLPAVRRVAPTWLVQMPWHLSDSDRTYLQREVAGASQDRMVREMGVLLEQLASVSSLLLVLEDLHWSDPATVQLLDHLARRRGLARLLILGTFRPADVTASEHPLGNLRHELRLHKLCQEIHLEGFNRGQIAEYVAARFDGARAEDTLVAALERHTDGLPLFLGGVLDELIEQGLARKSNEGSWQFRVNSDLHLPVPENLVGLAEKRMTRLPADVRQLLEAAALAASEFDHLSLAETLRADPAKVAEHLDGLARRKLWLRACEPHTLPDGRSAMRYSFLHALFRHAFARRVGSAARIELHRRLGLALANAYGDRAGEIASELAQHAEEGADAARAARWYAVAAHVAMRRIAPHEALAFADRGLAVLGKSAREDTTAELQLLSVRIGALMVTQGYSAPTIADNVDRAAELIEAQPLSAFTVPLWHAIWWALNNGGAWDRGRSLADHFLQLATGNGSAAAEAAALNIQGMIALFSNHYRDSLEPLRRSLEAQQRYSPEDSRVPFIQDLLIETLANLSVALDFCARFDEAAAVRADMERRIREGTDPLSEAMALWFMSCAAQHRRDIPEMLSVGERAMQLMSTRSALPGAGPHRVSRGWARVMSGDVTEGIAELRLGVELYQRQGSVMGMPWQRAAEAEAQLQAGNLSAAAEAIKVALEMAAETELSVVLPGMHRIHGAIRWKRGDGLAAAMQEWEHAIHLAQKSGGLLLELAAVTEMSSALVASNRVDEAAGRLREMLGRIDVSATCPAVRQARELVATLTVANTPA